jgi:autotransporter-associated beta strand protein/adhesin HecA-like repeat protein
LTLTASNHSYTGNTAVTGGELEVQGTLNDGDYAGAIAVSASATLRLNQTAAQRISGGISGSGNFYKDGAGELTVAAGGAKAIGGAYAQTAGVVNLETAFAVGSATVTTSELNVSAAAALTSTGAVSVTTSVVTVESGGTLSAGTTVAVTGSTVNVNAGTVSGATSVTVERSAVYLANGGVLSSSGGNVVFTGTSGTPTLVSGNGTITAGGSGAVTVDSYTDFAPGGNVEVGTININSGATVSFAEGWRYVVNIGTFAGAPAAGSANDVIAISSTGDVTVNRIALTVLIPSDVEIHAEDVFTILSAGVGQIVAASYADYELDLTGHSLAKVVASNGWTFEVARLEDGSGIVLQNGTAPVPPLPEPSTYGLLGGLAVLGVAVWRKRRKRELRIKD